MTIRPKMVSKVFGGIVAAALATCVCTAGQRAQAPVDPGVRGGAAGAGTPLPGLTADESAFFQDGLARFLNNRDRDGKQQQWALPRFWAILAQPRSDVWPGTVSRAHPVGTQAGESTG